MNVDVFVNNQDIINKRVKKKKTTFNYNSILRVIETIDTAVMTLPFALCWLLYYSGNTASPYHNRGNWLVIAIFVILFFTFGRIYDGFHIWIHRKSEIAFSQSLAAFFADAIMYLIILLLTKRFFSIIPFILAFCAQIVLAISCAYLLQNWFFHTFGAKRTAVIYDERQGMENMIKEYGLDRRFNILRTISASQCLANKFKPIDDVDVVFLFGVHSHDRNAILKWCISRDINVYMLPSIGDILVSGAQKMHLFYLPMLRASRYVPSPEYIFLKRLFDIVSSALAIVMLSPVMLVTAAAIKLTDGGPVLYKQCRLTKDRKEFTILKFRSMRVDAEKDGIARLSTGENDDRITHVGRFIRKIRIDEIPQLINILKGDMSVVGPRPERPEIAYQYEKELPEFALRLQVKAGLTGYAQVYGKYNTSPYDKLQMDLMYIANSGVWEDLSIIFATIKVLFMKESTEGVEKGHITAMGKDNGEVI